MAPTALQYFDSTQPVTIQVDASQKGLCAVLLQANGPVEFASKLLSDTESRYSNIEREMLAVLSGLEKFHYYAYGQPVVVESDHKPLEAIFKKYLSSAPPHIARMMLRIQKYDAQIKFVPGKDIPVADALSRISSCSGEDVQGLDVSLHEVHLHLNASPLRVSQIQDETAKDTALSALHEIIMHGWPEKRSNCPAYLHFFVICLFLLVHRRYNIKEVNLLITVYSIYTAYNLTKSRKKREVTIDKTLLGMSYIKQGNSTCIKDYLEILIYNI